MRGTQFAQLTAFVAVAEHNSFTRAATHLGISTPSLSQTIRSLEEQFGVRLLDRTKRSVAMTEAGEQLLAHLAGVGGLDSGLGPHELLLASLGACTAMTLRLYADRKRALLREYDLSYP
jgi:DNA-binding MarR family transcriptional regulator